MAKRGSSKKKTSKKTRPADPHIWQIQAVRDVLVVAAVLGVVWAGYALRAVTVPLLVALLLAYLFEPLVVRLSERPRMNRIRAVFGVLAAVGLGFIVVVAIAVPLAVGQTARLIGDIRDGTMRERVANLGEFVPDAYTREFDSLLDLLPGDARRADSTGDDAGHEDGAADGRDGASPAAPTDREPAPTTGAGPGSPGGASTLTEAQINELVDRRLAERLGAPDPGAMAVPSGSWGGLLRGGAQAVLRGVGTVVQVALMVFLIPFYFFFFSLWYHDVVQFLRKFIPEKNRDRWIELLGKMDTVVAGFVRGRIVISLIVGGILAIGWLICGVPYALTLGIVIGIFFLVPYLGGVGVPLAVGFLAIEYLGTPVAERDYLFDWWGVLLFPSLVWFLAQIIETYVLTPAIAGKATNLDPVTIIVAVLAGGSVLGVYGMLLAIPLAACGKILCTDVLLPRIHAWTRGEVRDPLPIGGEEE